MTLYFQTEKLGETWKEQPLKLDGFQWIHISVGLMDKHTQTTRSLLEKERDNLSTWISITFAMVICSFPQTPAAESFHFDFVWIVQFVAHDGL